MKLRLGKGVRRPFRFPWRTERDIRRDVDDELELHLALRAEELERGGLSQRDARREALRQFGDLNAARSALMTAGRRSERTRRLREMLAALSRDVRYAVRTLRNSPGYLVTATMVLALGVGSSIVVFTMLDALVLRPLPLRDPDRLFRIGTQPPPDAQWTMQFVGLPVFQEWQTRTNSLDGVAGIVDRQLTWQGPNGPERIAGAGVIGDLFPLLGATMTIGRSFTDSDEDRSTAILSHAFWRQRFGGRRSVLGETIELDGVTYTVVGVLPPETDVPFLGAQRVVWIPLAAQGLSPNQVGVNVVGRLRPGVDRNAAVAELATLQRDSEQARGVSPRSAGVVLQSIQEDRTALVGPTLFAMFGGSLVLLIVACANVGTLSLTRLMERRHEMAVRSSLGATRWNLVRQVVTEHVVLWAIGGAAGFVLGAAGSRWVQSAKPFPPARVPASDVIGIDGRVALFAFGITLLTALLFGSLSARHSSAAGPIAMLREDGATVSSSRTTAASRRVLVVAQVALSTVLASGACLLALSLFNLMAQPLGFRPADLSTFQVQLPEDHYPDQSSRLQFQRALLDALGALPGVEAAATTSALPLDTIPVFPSGAITLEGMESRSDRPWPGVQAIDRSYFATAGIEVVGGRGFDATDRAGGEPVLVVNKTFARTYFAGQDPVGRRLTVALPGAAAPWRLRIVGVVADVKHAGLDWDYLPELFLLYDQLPDGPVGAAAGTDLFALLRVPDSLRPGEAALRQAVSDLDRSLPLMAIRTGDQIIAASANSARFRAAIMGGVAVLAVLLSGLGLFAVLRQGVVQRQREFGIRMALGAAPATLLRAVCRTAIALAATGIAAGAAATFALARYMQSLLFGVSAIDPAVSAGVAGFMLLVAVAAAALPAWRTTKLSPTLAIRAAAGDRTRHR
ncbi:MAG TPA: ABC transporter permease [Gammaproteobacteria bacterium]|nr:ABC transporter permease [Gammaproteobacteria bacterium]